MRRKLTHVYQVPTTNSDGSRNRYLPLYADRRDALIAAEAHQDKDPKYNRYGGRWKVHIEPLPLQPRTDQLDQLTN